MYLFVFSDILPSSSPISSLSCNTRQFSKAPKIGRGPRDDFDSPLLLFESSTSPPLTCSDQIRSDRSDLTWQRSREGSHFRASPLLPAFALFLLGLLFPAPDDLTRGHATSATEHQNSRIAEQQTSRPEHHKSTNLLFLFIAVLVQWDGGPAMADAHRAPFPGGASSASAPTFGISPGPRRSSYASVVSGTAFSPPISASLTNLLNSDSISSYPPSSHLDGRPHRPLSGLDAADMHMNSAWRNMTSSDALPPFSRKYASLRPADSNTPLSFALSDLPSPFFTPSYLRDSRYISRLDAAHRAKLVAQQRDTAATSATNANPPLSTSSSNAHLPRMAPSHRGMTYDIIEKEPPTISDQPMPLPTQWGVDDRHDILEISSDGLEVRYTGPQHKTNDHEAAALRADNPMPPQCGIYYFEIKIESKPKEGYVRMPDNSNSTSGGIRTDLGSCCRMVAIGLSSPKASIERLPGWETESWAYHGDDGKSFFGESQGQGRGYGPTYGVGDTVGCGVNFSTRSAFFTKNGVFLGTAFSGLPDIQLYPSVGMKRQPPVCLKTNFGQEPFVFDIDGMVKVGLKTPLNLYLGHSYTNHHNHSMSEHRSKQRLTTQALILYNHHSTNQLFCKNW